ncbi:hypothetical protein BKA67DRAFT_652232 [Truncatella angustata]|uniref:N-acetyltransferase domain-containing protein n=1 Tax=Truncatella angustata TaxID=152316 RepID=A0A9P8UVF8_9PEZI|nr:uncharacterized protein BKA67DRAFT_652232 [Truncatella angustata]KAH6658957.1 hypothetical protein BKA67DRAFT_652232 [Truncatella angustata]KAH8203234.1 hypothetical protein TruAng_002639 [Truncatella angustata]
MAISLFVSVLAGLLLCFQPCCAQSLDQQHRMGGAAVPFEFRDAVLGDLDDFTTVIIDAFRPAPEWHYVYQFTDEYPGYTWHCQRQAWGRLFEQSPANGITIRVIAVPDTTSRAGSRVVSVSVWQFNRTTSSDNHAQTLLLPLEIAGGDWSNCSEHLDLNKTRTAPWQKLHQEAEKEYLDDVYDHQAYLAGLATHPKWDGNGFAATHLRWGLALADKWGIPATLTGTPAGHPLYRSLGFEDVHNITIERLDQKGVLWHEVMARPTKTPTDR